MMHNNIESPVTLERFAELLGVAYLTARKVVLTTGIRRVPGTRRWLLNPSDVRTILQGERLAA